MHILPGPIPTLTQSAPALARSRAALAVAMFPAIISKFGKLNSERAAFAISQRINKEILSNSSKI